MLRPSLTVVYRGADGREQRADALSISIVTRNGKYVIAYVSSGSLQTIRQQDLFKIEVSEASSCPWCDQNIEGNTPCNEAEKGVTGVSSAIKQPNTEALSKPECEPQAIESKDVGDKEAVIGPVLGVDDSGCEAEDKDG